MHAFTVGRLQHAAVRCMSILAKCWLRLWSPCSPREEKKLSEESWTLLPAATISSLRVSVTCKHNGQSLIARTVHSDTIGTTNYTNLRTFSWLPLIIIIDSSMKSTVVDYLLNILLVAMPNNYQGCFSLITTYVFTSVKLMMSVLMLNRKLRFMAR